MTKTFTTLEILNIAAWYKQLRENEKKPLNILPLNVQWALKKNITKMNSVSENFTQFREETDTQIRTEFATDEKSYEDTDENGQAIRKIKDEYLEAFQSRTAELNQKLNDILNEKNIVDISTINLDATVEGLDSLGDLTIDDLDMLSFMDESTAEGDA